MCRKFPAMSSVFLKNQRAKFMQCNGFASPKALIQFDMPPTFSIPGTATRYTHSKRSHMCRIAKQQHDGCCHDTGQRSALLTNQGVH